MTSDLDSDAPGPGHVPIFGRPISERFRAEKLGTRIVHWQSPRQAIGKPEADSIR